MPIGYNVTLSNNVESKTISVIATAGQTLFNVPGGYRLNHLDVTRNGVKLVETYDFIARDGVSVTLTTPSTVDDIIEFGITDTIRIADAVNANDDNVYFAGNVSIQGDLNVIGVSTIAGAATSVAFATTAYKLTGTPNIVAGIVTATSFSGPLSGNATGLSGIPNISVNNADIQGNLTVYGSTDSIGIITARSGINASGVSTFSSIKVGAAVTISGSGIDASGVTTSKSFVGNGIIPVGGIIMWSGSISNIPTGWALCDGANNTPDLRNRFVVGAAIGVGIGTSSSAGPSFDVNTGLAVTSYTPGNIGGEVAHQLSINEMPSHNHTTESNNATGGNYSGGGNSSNLGPYYGSNTGSTGGNLYHENRPPYYALAFIMRTA